MRKENKDYKPWSEYIADQKQKRVVAKDIASQIHALTAHQHVDIGELIGALQSGLLPTWKAAASLGLSAGAFLRLRRKYGLEPIYRDAAYGDPNKVRYLYAPEQLTMIPPREVELSKRRSAMSMAPLVRKKPTIDAAIDLDWVFRRTG